MHPSLVITAITVLIAVLPAVLRLMDEPIDWSRYSLIHHTARLARRALAAAKARRAARHPTPGHQHVWHHIATCRCGAIHTIQKTSTP